MRSVHPVIFLPFLFLLVIVAAQAEEQKVCCAETLSADTCSYVGASECKPGALQAATTCDKTSFCKLGCGFDQDSGMCFKSTPRYSCEQGGNCTWSESPTCDIPQCSQGCCTLSNECSFTTQIQCKKITSQFEDIEMDFKEEITDELTCVNQCRSLEKGACVSDDGSCKFTTREACLFETPGELNSTGPLVGFHPDRLCSNPQLGTECAAQQKTGCLPNADEVYWFDSCGNPENIYGSDKAASYNNGFTLSKEESCNPANANVNSASCGNCNYVLGSICSPAEGGATPLYGDYACKDLTCDALTTSTFTPSANTKGDIQDNGESWCAYDSIIGGGRDPVGSRHYRRLCINGIELTEPCKDFREELCIQGEQGKPPLTTARGIKVSNDGFVYGACRDNRWQSCRDQDKEDDCQNVAYRDCFWVGDDTVGKCLPMFPPGLKFWTDDQATTDTQKSSPKSDALSVCKKGNEECEVVYETPGLLGSAACVSNCECLEKDWLLGMNLLCKTYGDCGAYVNFLGKGTTGGYAVSEGYEGGKIDEGDLKDFSTLIDPQEGVGELEDAFDAIFTTYRVIPIIGSAAIGTFSLFFGGQGAGFFSGALSNILYGGGTFYPTHGANTHALISSNSFGTSTVVQAGTPVTLGSATAINSGTTFQADSINSLLGNTVTIGGNTGTISSQSVVGGGQNIVHTTATGEVTPLFTQAPGSELFTSTNIAAGTFADGTQLVPASTQQIPTWGGAGTFLSYVNTALLIWTIYNVLDVLLAEQEEVTVAFTCKPWVAPTGGSDCEKCQEDGKTCSAYRCRSLGQTCRLVNEGTSNELCINQHPNDVNPPIISADKDALTDGYQLTEQVGQGYVVTPDIEPFTALTLGVTVNEPSQCMYSINHSLPFEQMSTPFGNGLFNYQHNMTFSLSSVLAEEDILKLTNGGKYAVYVKCQDGAGNANNKDYYIKFAIKKGPDLTPPVIELTSIDNGVYVPADVNTTALTIYVNEPATCKWDKFDLDYGQMGHDFSCVNSKLPTSSIYYGLYDCDTVLTNIEQQTANNYYFRCKDQPTEPDESKKNVNTNSFVFTLHGTTPLKILSFSPQPGTEFFDSSPTLKLVTGGGAQNGVATCGYNLFDSSPANTIDFLQTNSTLHEQPFTNLTTGDYTAYFTCADIGGNVATEETTFSVSVDTSSPFVKQLYTEGSLLVIVVSEETTCEYSTTGAFTYGEGIQMTGTNTMKHEATLESDIYYISCEDIYQNDVSFVVYV